MADTSAADSDLTLPPVAKVDAEVAPLAVAIASLIAAIAAATESLTPARYRLAQEAVDRCSSLVSNPTLLKSATLRMLDRPPTLERALTQLESARSQLSNVAVQPLVEALAPLLRSLGDQGHDYLRQICRTLGTTLSEKQIEALGLGVAPGTFGGLTRIASRMFRSDNRTVALAEEVVRNTSDASLAAALQAARTAPASVDLLAQIDDALERATSLMDTTQQMREAYADQLNIAQSLDSAAGVLERQVRQRLRAIGRRIQLLRRHLREDIWAIAEDAGDEFEVDLRRRLERGLFLRNAEEGDLTDRQTSKNLKTRYDRLRQQFEAEVALLQQELAEFQEDFHHDGSTILEPLPRRVFVLAVPHASIGVRGAQVADGAATGVLAAGVASAAGTFGAMQLGYLAPAAILGVAIGPIGMAAAGAVAAAGAYKLAASRKQRMRRDVRQRRHKLQETLEELITSATAQSDAQLEAIATRFREVALAQLAPLRYEATRLREIAELHRKITDRICEAGARRIAQWQGAMMELRRLRPPAA
jgi:hypothetical protein